MPERDRWPFAVRLAVVLFLGAATWLALYFGFWMTGAFLDGFS